MVTEEITIKNRKLGSPAQRGCYARLHNHPVKIKQQIGFEHKFLFSLQNSKLFILSNFDP